MDLNKNFKEENNLHKELLALENVSGYVPNYYPFTCSICLEEYKVGKGITLRNCLHAFCKDCIINTIQHSDDAEIKCPFVINTNNENCDGLLMDGEIKALLSQAKYEKHLTKSLKIAELRIPNSFHCLTPNCEGWCINEDNRLNLFLCPICVADNCLKCNIIHNNLNCQQYQNSLNENDEIKSIALVENMITERTAMKCPSCQIVITKNGGCKDMVCSLCKHRFNWTGIGKKRKR